MRAWSMLVETLRSGSGPVSPGHLSGFSSRRNALRRRTSRGEPLSRSCLNSTGARHPRRNLMVANVWPMNRSDRLRRRHRLGQAAASKAAEEIAGKLIGTRGTISFRSLTGRLPTCSTSPSGRPRRGNLARFPGRQPPRVARRPTGRNVLVALSSAAARNALIAGIPDRPAVDACFATARVDAAVADRAAVSTRPARPQRSRPKWCI